MTQRRLALVISAGVVGLAGNRVGHAQTAAPKAVAVHVTLGTPTTPQLRLPVGLHLRWRAELAGGLKSVTPTPAGHLILVSMVGQVAELSEQGHELWSTALSTPAATPAVALASGLRVLMTADNRWLGFSEQGSLALEQTLDLPKTGPIDICAFQDGSWVASRDRHLIWLAPNGAVRAQALAPSRPSQLFAYREQLLLLDGEGQLAAWDGYTEPTWLNSLPRASNAALFGSRLYFANRERVGSYDMVRQRVEIDTEFAAATFVGAALPLGPNGIAVRTSTNSLLLGGPGRITEVNLGPAASTSDSPIQFLTDSKGALIALTPDGALTQLIQGETPVTEASARCNSPVVLTSTSSGNFVLGCADGQLYGFGDQTVPAPKPSAVRKPRSPEGLPAR